MAISFAEIIVSTIFSCLLPFILLDFTKVEQLLFLNLFQFKQCLFIHLKCFISNLEFNSLPQHLKLPKVEFNFILIQFDC